MKVETIRVNFGDLPRVSLTYIPDNSILIDDNNFSIFPNCFEELIEGDISLITPLFCWEIVRNIKHLVAGLYVDGERITQEHWINSPWNFLNPVTHDFALWKLTNKDILDNGYIVFVKGGKSWNRAFYDYNLNGPIAAAQRMTLLLGANYGVALNIRVLVDTLYEIRREAYGNPQCITRIIDISE